jgi:hypothetical protein
MITKRLPQTIIHNTQSSDTRSVAESVAKKKHLSEGDRVELNCNNRHWETWRVGREGNPFGRMVREK